MENSTPLFSVVVANYNNGRYLPFLVESLHKQTYTNWELLIADDASTDDSVAFIKDVANKDDRIKYVLHQENQGAGATFKSATDISKGELVGMLGADDALVENAIELMTKAHLTNENASIISSKAYDCDDDMKIIGLCDIANEQPAGLSFLYDILIGNFVTFKRSAYLSTTGFDPDQQRAVDHDIFLKLEEVGDVAFVDEPLYLYRRHLGGISQGNNGNKAAVYSLKAKLKAYKRRLDAGFTPNYTKAEYNNIAWLYNTRLVGNSRKAKQFSEAVAYNWKALKHKPTFIFQKMFWGTFYQAIFGRAK